MNESQSQTANAENKSGIKETLAEIVANCDRCGSCLNVCPLYAVTLRERAVARGKNSVLKAMLEGGLEADSKISEIFNYCLLCKACVNNCPSKIKTDDAMIRVRGYITDRAPLSLNHKGIGFFMKNNSLISMASFFIGLAKKTGVASLVPKAMIPEEFTKSQYQKMFTGPAAMPAAKSAGTNKITASSKVAYFRGCAMKLFFPEASADSVRVLSKTAQVDVVENVCCGMPHMAHGMGEDAVKLAETNIRLFEKHDIIVTDCASCGGTLKEYSHYFEPGSALYEKAEQFGKKVRGFSQYLVEVGYVPEYAPSVKLTFHDSCHLVRGQGIKAQPRELLKKSGEFVESLKSDMCCGGAGSFHMDFPEESSKILEEKYNCFRKSGADIIVTECPACMLQLKKVNDPKMQVMHISQVV